MFGIGKKRKEDCLLLTEDSRILEIVLSVEKGYAVEHKTREAWGLFPDSCIAERGTKKSFQVITERDCAPMSLNGGGDNSKLMKDALSKIAQEKASEARSNVQRKSLKSKTTETLLLLAIIFGVVIGMVVIFGLFASGKLHMPSFGGGGSSIF